MTTHARCAAAVHAIGEILASAPLHVSAPGRPFTAEDIVEALFNGDEGPFLRVMSDGDGRRVLVCVICAGEAHGADCPVGLLEAAYRGGVGRPLPPHIGGA